MLSVYKSKSAISQRITSPDAWIHNLDYRYARVKVLLAVASEKWLTPGWCQSFSSDFHYRNLQEPCLRPRSSPLVDAIGPIIHDTSTGRAVALMNFSPNPYRSPSLVYPPLGKSSLAQCLAGLKWLSSDGTIVLWKGSARLLASDLGFYYVSQRGDLRVVRSRAEVLLFGWDIVRTLSRNLGKTDEATKLGLFSSLPSVCVNFSPQDILTEPSSLRVTDLVALPEDVSRDTASAPGLQPVYGARDISRVVHNLLCDGLRNVTTDYWRRHRNTHYPKVQGMLTNLREPPRVWMLSRQKCETQEQVAESVARAAELIKWNCLSN